MTLLEILKKNVMLEPLILDLVHEFVLPKVRAYVASTPNKIDDSIEAAAESALDKLLPQDATPAPQA